MSKLKRVEFERRLVVRSLNRGELITSLVSRLGLFRGPKLIASFGPNLYIRCGMPTSLPGSFQSS